MIVNEIRHELLHQYYGNNMSIKLIQEINFYMHNNRSIINQIKLELLKIPIDYGKSVVIIRET